MNPAPSSVLKRCGPRKARGTGGDHAKVLEVVPINQMVVPMKIESERDLRAAAAGVQADMALLYTFNTQFNTETTIPALGVLTLGLFPNQNARVTSTASAALVDTRSGY